MRVQEVGDPTARAERRLDLAVGGLVFVASLILYAVTLRGDVQAADAGELQIAAWTLSIPHPPGYPLYTLLAWLASHLPVGTSPYFRISLLSALTSALGAGLLASLIAGIRPAGAWAGRIAGLGAGLVLATSVTFWAQATTANIRSLTALFSIGLVAAAVAADLSRRAGSEGGSRFRAARAALLACAAVLGLGVGHHVSLVFPGAVLGLFVLIAFLRAPASRRERGRGLIAAAGVFAASQVVWLLLPLRTAAPSPLDHGNLASLGGFLDHALARGFEGDFFYFVRVEPALLGERLRLLPQLFAFQFSPATLLVMAIGWAGLISRRRALGLTLAGAMALHLFITLTYRAPQTVEYALPAWVIAVAGAGLGSAALASPRLASSNTTGESVPDRRPGLSVRQRVAPGSGVPSGLVARLRGAAPLVLGAALSIIAMVDGVTHFPSFAQLAAHRGDRALAEAALGATPQNGTILGQWHQITPIWALQTIEGIRPDVQARYVYPEGAETYEDTFARRAAAAPATVLTVFGPQFAARGVCVDPIGAVPIWRATSCGSRVASTQSIVVFDKRIELVALESVVGNRPGESLLARVAWRARGSIQSGDALTIRFLYPDGRLAANTDITLDASQPVGETRSQLIALGLPLDIAPGLLDIRAGAYRPTGQGFVQYADAAGAQFPVVSRTAVSASSAPPATTRPMRWPQSCAASDRPTLIGLDYDLGIPGKMRVYTHWTTGVAASVTLRSPVAAPAMLALPATAGCATLIFDTAPANGLALDVDGIALALPDPRPGERYLPFADGVTLTGARIRDDDAAVTLDWLSGRALTTDYKISARIGSRPDGRHDGTPALGAIPTLKWIAGSRIEDVHILGAMTGAATLSGDVKVYDNFSQLPLPLLDPRYERDGAPLFRK